MEKKKGPIGKFFGEFKTFITRGNVLDMSVGVIVGGAFTAIVNGLSNFILKPLINWLIAIIMGKNSLGDIITVLGEPVYQLDANGDPTAILDLTQTIHINWGEFINAIINFLLIAFVLFLIVKVINNIAAGGKKVAGISKKEEKKAIRAIQKEQKVSKKEAKAIYEAKVAEEAAAAAEAERVAAEEVAAAEAAAAAEAEEKAMANTRLLEEILTVLKQK